MADAEYLTDEGKESLRAEAQEFLEKSQHRRRQFETAWALARKFVAGEQWWRASPNGTGIEPAPVGPKKPKITVNKLLPMAEVRLAHVLKNRPIAQVVPQTNSEEDRSSARIADDVLNYYFRAVDWEGKLSERIGPEAFTTGNVYLKCYWDPQAGEPEVTPQYVNGPDGQPIIDPTTGKPVALPSSLVPTPRGEPCLDPVMPEEVYDDPGARHPDESEMLIHRCIKPIDYIRKMFPDRAEEVKPIDLGSDLGRSLLQASKQAGFADGDLKTRCVISEVWARPDSEKWPKGLHAIIVNEEVWLAEPTPPGHAHIPFHLMKEKSIAGYYYGTSAVIQGIDSQKALNLSVSRDQYRRNVQRPFFVVDNDSGIDDTDITNDDKDILVKNRGSTATWEAPPAYADDKMARDYYEKAIDDAGGGIGILAGDPSGEVRSGRQAWIQGENAGVALSGASRAVERAVQWLGRTMLNLLRENVKTKRFIQIVGEDRAIEVKQFESSDLKGAGDYYVVPGSALPMSVSQKRQMILDLVDRGILDPMKAQKMLPFPSDLDAQLDDDALDRDRAVEENELFASLSPEQIDQIRSQGEVDAQEDALATGQPPDPLRSMLKVLKLEPREFENWQVHLDTHNRFRKSRRYRALPEEVQAMLDHHCDLHIPPAPPMPAGEGKDGGQPGAGGQSSPAGTELPTPNILAPGGSAVLPNPEGAGDQAAGMPAMPPTPTPGNHALM